ncbi:hypothetical protein FAZ69_02660 [Trinickia terrae]|uniref:LysR substrate-binding domain-containing protein n=1 Tax=Trinickia terrae TaxID=2571161 RepID=A0A4U1IFT1_9BURK|nr:hypothetical protein FAZ69_02660 [Trinickia terrae]
MTDWLRPPRFRPEPGSRHTRARRRRKRSRGSHRSSARRSSIARRNPGWPAPSARRPPARRNARATHRFDLTPRRVDLVSEPFDVAIRVGEPESSQLIARPLASFRAHLYASPRYLERAGEPREPADLKQHECLGILRAGSWTLHDGTNTVPTPAGSRFTVNSVGMIRRLATLDMGIVPMAKEIVADDLSSGRLRRVMPQWQGTPIPVYAITETRLLPAKTQRFIEFLRERFAQ